MMPGCTSAGAVLRAPFRHLVNPSRPPLVELAGKNQQPFSGRVGRVGEDIGEFSGPFRPSLAAGEIGNGIGSFPERCDGGRDLVKGVVAGPLQDLRTPGAAGIERAVPVAGDFGKMPATISLSRPKGW